MQLRTKNLHIAALFVVFSAATTLTAASQTSSPQIQWQPTHPAVHVEDYAGASSCVSCHRKQSQTQMMSEMGLSLLRPADAQVLANHARLTFQRGPYRYTLSSESGYPTFTVEDGHNKITEPFFMVVGSGKVFQAYLIQHAGEYYRAPVDYFTAQGKLGLDTEANPELPLTLDAALGQRLTADNVKGCFRCHSPASVVGDHIDTTTAVRGITCEVCHGPGAKHVAAIRSGKPTDSTIFNPAHLSAYDKSGLCNQCHTSAAKMKEQNPHGVRNVVSPAFRLEQSRCFSNTDARTSCTLCHDPHVALVRETTAYDAKCLACHAQQTASQPQVEQPAKQCKVGQRDCVRCHMPRVNIPNSPILFTDHRIRIAAAGAPYPD
jgi:hypothetical protein